VPMLAHGDELGRTQQGNNNVYCQDNELSWVDWAEARDYDVLTRFTGELTRLRTEHPIFRRRRFFDGHAVGDQGATDIAWLRSDAEPMNKPEDWNADRAAPITVFLNGRGIPERDALGEPIVDDSFLVLFNPLDHEVDFTLPGEEYGPLWEVVVDSADPLLANVDQGRPAAKPGSIVPVEEFAVIVLRCPV
jgi:isoamylase